jgi:hypothetical protein
MSQEPWICNGEDPWLSSKGRTMCVGKVVICSHGLSSIVWSENRPCCGTIAYFVGKKDGRIWFNIKILKLYQFKRIIWWCLLVLESILEYVLEFAMHFVMKVVILEKILKKSWSPGIFVSLEVGLTQIPVDHAPLSIVRHVGLHVDFSSTNLFFGPLGLHLLAWSELERSPPFRPMSSYIAMVKGLHPCVWSGPKLCDLPSWSLGIT